MPATISTDSKEMDDAESSPQSEDMQSEAGSRIRTGEDDEDDVEDNTEGLGESSNSPTPGTLTALEERKSRMERLRKKIVRPLHHALSLGPQRCTFPRPLHLKPTAHLWWKRAPSQKSQPVTLRGWTDSANSQRRYV